MTRETAQRNTAHFGIQPTPRKVWASRRDTYLSKARSRLTPILNRRQRRQKNPVEDFLFEYYSFRPASLLTWSPGWELLCLDADKEEIPQAELEAGGARVSLDRFPAHRWDGLRWVLSLLTATQRNPPSFSCFGLHEWAMVYQCSPRHSVPLRYSPEDIKSIVEKAPLCCTHWDAFRFFSKSARPRNRWNLVDIDRRQIEQPGCIHVTMDLYKWAYKFFPWIESELIWDCFTLAWDARELDMRASPYDLGQWGYQPVAVETPEGRHRYERAQRVLSQRAAPVRDRLIRALKGLETALTPVGGT